MKLSDRAVDVRQSSNGLENVSFFSFIAQPMGLKVFSVLLNAFLRTWSVNKKGNTSNSHLSI